VVTAYGLGAKDFAEVAQGLAVVGFRAGRWRWVGGAGAGKEGRSTRQGTGDASCGSGVGQSSRQSGVEGGSEGLTQSRSQAAAMEMRREAA